MARQELSLTVLSVGGDCVHASCPKCRGRIRQWRQVCGQCNLFVTSQCAEFRYALAVKASTPGHGDVTWTTLYGDGVRQVMGGSAERFVRLLFGNCEPEPSCGASVRPVVEGCLAGIALLCHGHWLHGPDPQAVGGHFVTDAVQRVDGVSLTPVIKVLCNQILHAQCIQPAMQTSTPSLSSRAKDDSECEGATSSPNDHSVSFLQRSRTNTFLPSRPGLAGDRGVPRHLRYQRANPRAADHQSAAQLERSPLTPCQRSQPSWIKYGTAAGPGRWMSSTPIVSTGWNDLSLPGLSSASCSSWSDGVSTVKPTRHASRRDMASNACVPACSNSSTLGRIMSGGSPIRRLSSDGTYHSSLFCARQNSVRETPNVFGSSRANLASSWSLHHVSPWTPVCRHTVNREQSNPGSHCPSQSFPSAFNKHGAAAVAKGKENRPGQQTAFSSVCTSPASSSVDPSRREVDGPACSTAVKTGATRPDFSVTPISLDSDNHTYQPCWSIGDETDDDVTNDVTNDVTSKDASRTMDLFPSPTPFDTDSTLTGPCCMASAVDPAVSSSQVLQSPVMSHSMTKPTQHFQSSMPNDACVATYEQLDGSTAATEDFSEGVISMTHYNQSPVLFSDPGSPVELFQSPLSNRAVSDDFSIGDDSSLCRKLFDVS